PAAASGEHCGSGGQRPEHQNSFFVVHGNTLFVIRLVGLDERDRSLAVQCAFHLYRQGTGHRLGQATAEPMLDAPRLHYDLPRPG
ncbi:hypothetical protein, partial [Listeria monocytogenes]|uniref:hypothetical protein n=1 Tax=Listeria monocytogenes TaxID=1639 RepID=UPI003F678387